MSHPVKTYTAASTLQAFFFAKTLLEAGHRKLWRSNFQAFVATIRTDSSQVAGPRSRGNRVLVRRSPKQLLTHSGGDHAVRTLNVTVLAANLAALFRNPMVLTQRIAKFYIYNAFHAPQRPASGRSVYCCAHIRHSSLTLYEAALCFQAPDM